MAITLKQLIDALAAEGVVGDEAEAAVERFLEAKRGSQGALATRGASGVDFPISPQTDLGQQRRAVDYGNETAEQAKRRWIEQEMEDPNGVYAGGSTAGGIFGDGPIVTETYDPMAHRRTEEVRQMQMVQRQSALNIAVLEKLAERLGVGIDDIRGELEGAPTRQLRGRR